MIDETLQLARQGLAPTSVERQRLRAAIAARAAPPVSTGSVEATPRGWSALKASGASGLAAGAALLALGFAGGLLIGSEHHASMPTAPAATLTAPAATLAPVVDPAALASASPNVPVPAPDPIVAPAPSARARPTARRSDAFERELALLQRAERAIRNEDPALALSLLGELEREYPRAALAEERKAARVMANCQANEPTAALAAERFLREAPSSVYSDRVRALCRLEGEQRTLSR
jgi:hypothetical protein